MAIEIWTFKQRSSHLPVINYFLKILLYWGVDEPLRTNPNSAIIYLQILIM